MIKVLKPFKRVVEGEYFGDSLIAYAKVPWLVKNSGKKQIVLKNKYFLYINLWLLILNFEWILKTKQYEK